MGCQKKITSKVADSIQVGMQTLYHFAKRHKLTSHILQRLDTIVSRQVPPSKYPIYCRRFSNHWVKASYEADVRRALSHIVREKRCKVLYDIGANVGIFSLDFLSYCPQGSVIAFEPNPRVFTCLEMTKNKNQLNNLEIHKLALSDCNGTATLVFDPMSPALGGLHPVQYGKFNHELRYGGISEKCTVQTLTLDSFVSYATPPPEVLKIDAEGEELKILEGAKKVLEKHQPILLFECTNYPEKVATFLMDSGYEIFDIQFKTSPIQGMNFAIPKRGR